MSGDDRVQTKIQVGELDLAAIARWCKHEEAGAVVHFEGTTRNNFEDKTVVTLSYECYEEMALSEMNKICLETLEKFPQARKVALHHRIDVVPVKEVSVIASVSTEHRKQGFEACEYLMNELKARVPVWKKEIYSDHAAEWKQNKEWECNL
jgi:molybdopterin synthase catalytic subunit